MSRKGPGTVIASPGEPDENPDEPGDSSSSEGIPDDLTTNLEGVLDLLAAKYCPHCGTRRPVDESVCPTDGTALRDLSITTGCGWGSTAFPLSATGSSGTSLAELMESHVTERHPEDDFQITGVVLGGKWRVEKLVGEGTFGAFFLGRHVTLGMQVGIKILRQRFTRTDAGLRLFHNEAMRLSLLHHPGIVQVLDYGEERDRPYLVMEYLTGKPLHKVLGDRSFSVDDGVEVIRQAAEALIAAHRGVGVGEPLVHLDLKPEHIFLERIQGRWHVKVIDFGIAEIAAAPSDPAVEENAGKKRKRLAGTLPYMAPERWDGAVDPRCDLYSLGIVLYELIAGRKPFDIWDPEAMRILHTREKPTPPSRHRLRSREPGLKELDAIVLRLLEKDAARRPQSAEELVEILKRWQGRPPWTPGQRLARACVVPATLLLLALGLVAWAPWDGITFTQTEMVIGPRGLKLQAVVRGMGYDTASLRVRSEEGTVDVPLGAVQAGGRIEHALQLGDFCDLPRGKVLEAGLLASGPLWRRLSLHGLSVRLDKTPPEVLEINGNPPPPGGQSLRLLRGGEGKLQVRVRAGEPLDPSECTLNRSTAKEESKETGNSGDVLFELAEDATSVELVLVDPAGNEQTCTWMVDWRNAHAPRLLPPAVRRTSQAEYHLVLEWNQDPGTVNATVGSRRQALKAAREADSYWRARARVTFDPGAAGREVTRKVRVEAQPDGAAAGADEVEVRWLQRKLVVQREAAGDVESLPVLYAEDAAGKRLKDEEILHWELTIVWNGGRGTRDAWQVGLDAGPSLQLDVEKHLQGKAHGKFQILGTVTDAYGNRSPVAETLYVRDVTDPRIGAFGLADQEPRVIHHESCPLSGSQQRLVLAYEVEYEHEVKSLSLELWLEGRDHDRALVSFDRPEDGRLEVSLAGLRNQLKVGRNKIILIVKDPDTLKPVKESCFLDYEGAPTAEVGPPPQEPVENDLVEVVITASRPDVTSVHVNGTRADAGGRDHAAKVKLSPAGETPVRIRVTFKGGCTIDLPVQRYSRAPRQGTSYVLPLEAGRAPFELRYCEELRLWYTPLRAEAAFEGASASPKQCRPALERFLSEHLGKGIRWELGLPTEEELEAISRIEARQGAGAEWMAQTAPSSQHPAISDLRRFFERDERGKWSVVRAPDTRQLPYRLILRNLDPRHGVNLPRHAAPAARQNGGGT